MLRIAPYRRSRQMAIGLTAILLTACAGQKETYPSLAIRDVERVEGSFQPETASLEPVAESPPSADLVERLAQLQNTAASAHRSFMAAAPETTRLVNAAAGTDVTSDRWAGAQVALAGLDSSRSQAAVPLGDLDLLHADAAIALEQRQAIQAARMAVIGLIAEEDAILSDLRDKMR